MIHSITVSRGNTGKHGDVLDACEVLVADSYSTAANALAVMARQSPLFRKTIKKCKRRKKRSTPRR